VTEKSDPPRPTFLKKKYLRQKRQSYTQPSLHRSQKIEETTGRPSNVVGEVLGQGVSVDTNRREKKKKGLLGRELAMGTIAVERWAPQERSLAPEGEQTRD